MGLFTFLRQQDINVGLERFRNGENAVLVDVRTPAEYRQGHIPGSKNIPLDMLGSISDAVKDKSTHVFLYCRSGSRSAQAVLILKRMGYGNAENIGGISGYHGEVEK